MGQIRDAEGDRTELLFGFAEIIFEHFDAIDGPFHVHHQGLGRLLLPFQRRDVVRDLSSLSAQFLDLRQQCAPLLIQLQQAIPIDMLRARPEHLLQFFRAFFYQARIEHNRATLTPVFRIRQSTRINCTTTEWTV